MSSSGRSGVRLVATPKHNGGGSRPLGYVKHGVSGGNRWIASSGYTWRGAGGRPLGRRLLGCTLHRRTLTTAEGGCNSVSRILVTGGLGTVGRVLVRTLRGRGHSVKVLGSDHYHEADYVRCD